MVNQLRRGRRGACLIGFALPVLILCFTKSVRPISLAPLENKSALLHNKLYTIPI